MLRCFTFCLLLIPMMAPPPAAAAATAAATATGEGEDAETGAAGTALPTGRDVRLRQKKAAAFAFPSHPAPVITAPGAPAAPAHIHNKPPVYGQARNAGAALALSSVYGERRDPINGARRWHQGIDIPGRQGTPVLASADGRVRRAGPAGGYGIMVEIGHADGLTTRYAHLSRLHVRAGEQVSQGQIIAAIGSTGRSTGPHLHFEVRVDGAARNPLHYLGGPSPHAPAHAPTSPFTIKRDAPYSPSAPYMSHHGYKLRTRNHAIAIMAMTEADLTDSCRRADGTAGDAPIRSGSVHSIP